MFDPWDEKSHPCQCTGDGCPNQSACRQVGVDGAPTYADVEVLTCGRCGRYWLSYFFEYEAFTDSATLYRGIITAKQASAITEHDAIDVFARMQWYYRHASGQGVRVSGRPDLM